MKSMTRLWAVAAAALTMTAAAHAADATFMSFTYAEEANTKTVQALLDDFKAQDGLTVEPLGFAWGDMQKNIFLRARSNTLPDIAQLSERWLPTFAGMGQLVDLNTVFGKDKLEASFAPDALAMGNIGGKQLALPLISGTIGMVANKAVLEKAGITAPPKTVEEFKKDLVAVRDKVANSVPYSMATKNNGSILIDFMLWNWVHGGRIIDDEGKVVVDSDASRAALQFMVDLVKERLAAPEIDRPDSRRLTAQGASAFYFDAPQTRTFLRDFSGQGEAFDAKVLPMETPVLKAGDKPVSVQWGHLLVQFSADGKAAADAPADRFLAYLTSDKVQTDFPLKMSALPVTKSARQAVADDKYLTAWAAATGDARRNEVGIWSNAAELTQIIGEEAQAAMLGQKSAADAIGAMQSRLTESMAKAKKSN